MSEQGCTQYTLAEMVRQVAATTQMAREVNEMLRKVDCTLRGADRPLPPEPKQAQSGAHAHTTAREASLLFDVRDNLSDAQRELADARERLLQIQNSLEIPDPTAPPTR